MKRTYARKKGAYQKENYLCVESIFNRDQVLTSVLEGSVRNLDAHDSNYLALIKSNKWSAIESNDSGVHIRVEFAKDSFVRLDRLSQRQLAKNVRKMMSGHMNDLASIYNRRKIRGYFLKWRSCVVTRMDRFVFRYKSSLRYTFLMWKTYALSRRLTTRSRRQSCISLGCLMWRNINDKLKKAFKQWRVVVRSWSRLLRHTFDEWSLWALRSKLLKCNLLRVFKALSARKTHRSSKRIRWYFEYWRETAQELTALFTLRKSFSRYDAYDVALVHDHVAAM
jgi:hypothetical protein